jgi:hypothetical protein
MRQEELREKWMELVREDIESLRRAYLLSLPLGRMEQEDAATEGSAFATLAHISHYFVEMAHFRDVLWLQRRFGYAPQDAASEGGEDNHYVLDDLAAWL